MYTTTVTVMLGKEIISCSALLILLAVRYANSAGSGPDETCLYCLCNAVSNCNFTFGCDVEVNPKQCGPFRITEPFWIDGSRPVLALDDPKSPGAFPRCAVDPMCSATAVSNYMKLYGADCNRDGVLDCIDYAYLHQNGPSCAAPIRQNFLETLKNCLNPKGK